MPTKRVPTREPRALSTEQKIAFALLMFLGIGGAFLGARSFKVSISKPFDLQLVKYLSGEKFMTTSQREAQDLEASKTRDTDGDGLSDYDELYVYKTSPYLSDSDSDGFDDKTEAFSGNDPNCPRGKVCEATVSAEEVGNATATPNIVVPPVPDVSGLTGTAAGASANAALGTVATDPASLLSTGSYNFKTPDDVKKFYEQASPADIRAALLKAGMTQAQLDKIDDTTLKQFFSQTLETAAQKGDLNALIKTDTQTSTSTTKAPAK